MLRLYTVSFHMAHLYDEDPDFLHDRVLVDAWEDWLEPVAQEQAGSPIDQAEHELSPYEKRTAALQTLLREKGILKVDESRRLVVEQDYLGRGTRHPMVGED